MNEIISSYSAEEAVEDGFLTPTTDLVPDEDMAAQAGLNIPVRLTPGIVELVEPGDMAHQDLKGRLWDLLWMLSLAAKRSDQGEDLIVFKVLFQTKHSHRPKEFKLWAAIDMTSGPAIHVMLPEEY